MNEVTLHTQADPMALVKSRVFGGGGLGLLTSLPMTTPEEKALVLRLSKSDSDNSSKVLGKEITITDVIFHPVQVNAKAQVDRQTGEVLRPAGVVDAIRTVLILKGGKQVATVSDGIVKEIAALVAVFGEMPWKEGVTVEFQQIETRAGQRTYQLLPVIKAKK